MTKEKRDRLMQEAVKFNGFGDCYIHVEMKDGKRCERIVAGDGVALIHGIVGLIDRLGELTDSSFETTLMAIQEYKINFMD